MCLLKNMKLLLPILLALCSLQGVKAETVEFRTVRFDPEDRPPPEYQSIDGSTKFSVPLHTISDSYKLPLRDDRFLELKSIDGGKLLALEIPPSMRKNLLLLFVPESEGYKIIPVHAPASRFGGGDCFMVNACTSDLAIRYGKNKPITLAPASSAILKSTADKKYEMLPVVIAENKNDKWEIVRSERWPSDPRFRTILFTYKLPRTGNLEIHAIPERIVSPSSSNE